MLDPLEGLSSEGFITTGARRARVPAAFEPVLDEVLAATSGQVGELHLYGSVATGRARRRSSDIDLLAVDADPEAMERVGRLLGAQLGDLCRGVHIGVAEPGDFAGEGDAAYGNRVFLRHYCVPLLGQDAYRSPHPFRGDLDAARGFNGDLAEHLERWRAGEPGPALAQRVARKTLLAVAGLVSVVEHTWTTDRATATLRWSRQRPWWRDRLLLLQAWAHGVPARPGELADALAPDGVVEAVVTDFRAQIGLWR